MSEHRAQTRAEELANTSSHGLGLVAALALTPFLVLHAVEKGRAASVVGASVFAASMVVLYLASTLYHAARSPRAKHVFRVLDHAAIFLLIAGTYTPFTLGVLAGAWGWTLFGVIWSLAVAGVVSKLVAGFRFPKLSVLLYVAMGWLVLIAIQPLAHAVQPWGLFWLGAGGVAYTSGVFFYAAKRVPHAHFVWHLFVMAGTACHAVAVFGYAA